MKSTSQATRPRAVTGPELFDSGSIWRILARIAPPVMFSQLILSLYNIVDSYFVGQYTADGLTALSVVYPIQIVITALAVGTGVGVNTHMARMYAQHRDDEADKTAGAYYLGNIRRLFGLDNAPLRRGQRREPGSR